MSSTVKVCGWVGCSFCYSFKCPNFLISQLFLKAQIRYKETKNGLDSLGGEIRRGNSKQTSEHFFFTIVLYISGRTSFFMMFKGVYLFDIFQEFSLYK